MDFATASFIEPSSVVVHGMRQVDIKPGSSVAIVGCGTIGLLAVQWAKNCGAGDVFAFDTDEMKLALAAKTGQQKHSASKIKPFSRFREITHNAGVDVVLNHLEM